MPLHIQPPDPYPDVPFTLKKKNKANDKVAANLLPDQDRSPSPPPRQNIFREDLEPDQGGNDDPNNSTNPEQEDSDVLGDFAEFGGNVSTSAGAEFDEINTMSDSRWNLFLEETSVTGCDIDDLPSLDLPQPIHQLEGSDEEEVVFAVRRGISNDHEDAKLAESIDGMIHKNRKLCHKSN